MLLKNRPYESYAKNTRSKMLPKKLRRETIAENKRSEMLLKNLPYKSYAKNIRSKMLSKKLRRETIDKSKRTEMLLKIDRTKAMPKISVAKCCRKNYEEKLSPKISVPKCCSKICRTKATMPKNIRSKMLPKKLRSYRQK